MHKEHDTLLLNLSPKPQTLNCPVQTIVMHKEHDTLYAVDPACRSFSFSTLKLMVGTVLENMPGGMPSPGASAQSLKPNRCGCLSLACDVSHALSSCCK